MYVVLWFMGVYIYTFKSDLTAKLLKKSYSTVEIASFLGIDINKFKNSDNTRNLFNEIFAMFILDLPESEYSSLISGEKVKFWNQSINELFRGGNGWPDQGERVDIVIDAIKVMQMS